MPMLALPPERSVQNGSASRQPSATQAPAYLYFQVGFASQSFLVREPRRLRARARPDALSVATERRNVLPAPALLLAARQAP